MFFWRGLVKKICPKHMIFGASGVILGDLGTFWNDFSDFRMQCVFIVLSNL